jgi:hypothetical protein
MSARAGVVRVALLCASALALAALGGCDRKAPGPFECQEMGARVLGITDSRALSDPKVKEALDTFTTECLTAPFDERTMLCLEKTNNTRLCLADLARRRPELQHRPQK